MVLLDCLVPSFFTRDVLSGGSEIKGRRRADERESEKEFTKRNSSWAKILYTFSSEFDDKTSVRFDEQSPSFHNNTSHSEQKERLTTRITREQTDRPTCKNTKVIKVTAAPSQSPEVVLRDLSSVHCRQVHGGHDRLLLHPVSLQVFLHPSARRMEPHDHQG